MSAGALRDAPSLGALLDACLASGEMCLIRCGCGGAAGVGGGWACLVPSDMLSV